MPPIPKQPAVTRRGFTLVEVMLAVLLGSMVVTVTSVIAIQSVAIQQAAKSEMRQRWDRLRVFHQFETDLQAILTWLPAGQPVVRINSEPGRVLEFLCLAAVPDQVPARRRMPAKVSYLVENDPAHRDFKQLVREVHDLTRPEPVTDRRVLADGLAEVAVKGHTGAGWVASFPNGNRVADALTAVRVVCRWASSGDIPETHTCTLPAPAGGS